MFFLANSNDKEKQLVRVMKWDRFLERLIKYGHLIGNNTISTVKFHP